jgi:hypothetical protein
MAAFKRGLDESFVDRLNAEYEEAAWWKDIVDDPALFIGIRDNYLNVYYQGNSILLLTLDRGRLVGKTHYKFLLREKIQGNQYIHSAEGRMKLTQSTLTDLFIQDLGNLPSLMAACIPYAGVEKAGVHDIIKGNRNVVDVEIALTGEKEDELKPTALRVDFTALQETPESIELVFFEAKHFSNKELRANGSQTPRVVGQVQRYEKLVARHREDIESSYRRICENIVALKGIRTPKIVRAVAQGKKPLLISDEPRLVIFGFDDDQKKGKVWAKHRNKLYDMLGKNRVLLRGNAKGFTVGISRPLS